MASWLICCFIVILLYIERKWLPKRKLATILPLYSKLSGKFQRFNAIGGSIKCQKIVKFPKISIKTFYESQIAKERRKLFSPLPDKISLRLWNKYFLTKVYRNIQTFDFQVPRECSSWTSRNGAVQMFFLTPTKKLFLSVLQEEIIQSPPNKSFLRLLNKYFLNEVYMNIQTFDFQVLRECSSIFPNFEWVEVRKMNEVF